jgi:hypothetical protein
MRKDVKEKVGYRLTAEIQKEHLLMEKSGGGFTVR